MCVCECVCVCVCVCVSVCVCVCVCFCLFQGCNFAKEKEGRSCKQHQGEH